MASCHEKCIVWKTTAELVHEKCQQCERRNSHIARGIRPDYPSMGRSLPDLRMVCSGISLSF